MALINTTTQLREYVTVGKDLSYESIQPQIFMAENKYIIPFLGRALYDHLEENDGVEDYEDLLAFARSAAAKFALWLYITPGGKQIDDMGAYMAKTDNMWRLSPEELRELKKSLCEDAMDALDMLLVYLEENAVAAADDAEPEDLTAFNLWHASPTRKRYAGALIKSAEVFCNYVELFRSTLTFMTMADLMRTAEKHQLARVMGAYLPTLKALTAPTGDDAILLEYAQEALAKLTAAKALGRGFHFIENNQLSMSMSAQKPAPETLNSYVSEAQDALERLRAKLEELTPVGYTPLTPQPADSSVLRKPGSKVFLA